MSNDLRQADIQCKCGSWYIKLINGNYCCNLCGKPFTGKLEKIIDYAIKYSEGTTTSRSNNKREQKNISSEKEIKPEAIQISLDL